MADHLERLIEEVKSLVKRVKAAQGSVGVLTSEASVLANDAARLFINEVLDWRVMLLDRPLQPP